MAIALGLSSSSKLMSSQLLRHFATAILQRDLPAAILWAGLAPAHRFTLVADVDGPVIRSETAT